MIEANMIKFVMELPMSRFHSLISLDGFIQACEHDTNDLNDIDFSHYMEETWLDYERAKITHLILLDYKCNGTLPEFEWVKSHYSQYAHKYHPLLCIFPYFLRYDTKEWCYCRNKVLYTLFDLLD
jgi:hypothetical protein